MSSNFTSLTPRWANPNAQETFNEIVRRVGCEEDAVVIDLVKHVKENVPNWEEHLNLFYDGVHVTDEGSRVYGGHIAECLLPLVRVSSSEALGEAHRMAAQSNDLQR